MNKLQQQVKIFAVELIALYRRLLVRHEDFPDFIVIGVQKGGTSSIFNYLSQHPQINPPLKKQVHFFDKFYSKGIKWYLSFFPKKKKGMVSGEASPYYIYHPLAAKRMAETSPNTKIIVLLRHPLNRMNSHFQMIKKKQRENSTTLNDALKLEEERLQGEEKKIKADGTYQSYSHQTFSYLSRSLYYKQLIEWQKHFSKEQFLLVQSEEFFHETPKALSKIYNFLGIENVIPKNIKVLNKGDYKKSKIEIDKEFLNLIKYDMELLEKEFDFHPDWNL